MDALTMTGVVVVAVLSITSHEAAHGFIADRLGDSTAREQGRLTLNPIPVNVSQLRHPRRDWALVGAAGPAMNMLIALGLTALLSTATHLGLADVNSNLTRILAIGIFLNVLLAIFNLIPIPPLDGSRVLQYFISGEALVLYRRLEQFGLFIILALLFLVPGIPGLLAAIIFDVVEFITRQFGVWADVEPLLRSLLIG